LLDGEYMWYREDGSIEQQATYEKGVPVGKVKFWDEQGNLKPDSGNMRYCQRFCINLNKR
ncbi:MAG: hypothetical protein JNL74_19520, partial [Fibrobacteres bacterium]|nr:hypothetical protein [Fibrobacterota bacterium]